MEEQEEKSPKEDDTSSGGNSEVATPTPLVTLLQARPNLCTRPFIIDDKRLW